MYIYNNIEYAYQLVLLFLGYEFGEALERL